MGAVSGPVWVSYWGPEWVRMCLFLYPLTCNQRYLCPQAPSCLLWCRWEITAPGHTSRTSLSVQDDGLKLSRETFREIRKGWCGRRQPSQSPHPSGNSQTRQEAVSVSLLNVCHKLSCGICTEGEGLGRRQSFWEGG